MKALKSILEFLLLLIIISGIFFLIVTIFLT